MMKFPLATLSNFVGHGGVWPKDYAEVTVTPVSDAAKFIMGEAPRLLQEVKELEIGLDGESDPDPDWHYDSEPDAALVVVSIHHSDFLLLMSLVAKGVETDDWGNSVVSALAGGDHSMENTAVLGTMWKAMVEEVYTAE